MLSVKIMTLMFDEVRGGYDDSALNDFLREYRVVEVKPHFFIKSETPYITLIITYHMTVHDVGRAEANAGKIRDPQDSWKNLLQESDMGLFQLLREWRGKRARQEGVPPYVVLTNRQLAYVTRARPQSLSELQRIDGFGEAKMRKFGEELLAITKIEAPVLTADLTPDRESSTHDG
jgi:superfamily II DNA helicase RecQ